MGQKKAFLLRLDADTLDALQKWAADDLRSANAQIEFLLRRVLKESGRLSASQSTEDHPDERIQDQDVP